MSIATEIERLQTAKADIKTAIENKGVTVGDKTIDTYAELISKITSGSSGKKFVEGTVTFVDVTTAPTVEHNLGVVPTLFMLLPDYEIDYTIDAENAAVIVSNEIIQTFVLNAAVNVCALSFETRAAYGTYGAWFTVNNGNLTETTAKLPQRSASYRYRAGVPYKWIAIE